MDVCPSLVRIRQNETVVAISDGFNLKQVDDPPWVTASFRFKYWCCQRTNLERWRRAKTAVTQQQTLTGFRTHRTLSTTPADRKPWSHHLLLFQGQVCLWRVTLIMASLEAKHYKSGISSLKYQTWVAGISLAVPVPAVRSTTQPLVPHPYDMWPNQWSVTPIQPTHVPGTH